MLLKKKYTYLLTIITAIVILFSVGYIVRTSASKNKTFIAKEINFNTFSNKKIRIAIEQICKDNGVFLYNLKDNATYLILDGSHANFKGEAPYFSDVKIEAKENSIRIYFTQELKNYPFGKYPQQKLVYKITKDKKYDYIKVFKDGVETHFDSIGA
ncbi:hypothetical protein HMPREF1982_02323 [Clostridiales bacterium oral taxon 876 str. F0540]|nr:hypothetical protein HMPREF1982_02323 [Clostridiales bacterium oral taxon 876 str. F0540]